MTLKGSDLLNIAKSGIANKNKMEGLKIVSYFMASNPSAQRQKMLQTLGGDNPNPIHLRKIIKSLGKSLINDPLNHEQYKNKLHNLFVSAQ